MALPDVTEWYREAFRRGYLDVYRHRDESAATREAEFVTRVLGLAAGDLVLDAACGAGRHARALAARGARVVGADLSADLLADAVERSRDVRYVLADVRVLPFRDGAFAHAVSLFTSFGYFEDATNARHLAEIRRVLRQGGAFVLDFLNAPRVERALVPASERVAGDMVIHEERRIRAGRVEKTVEIRRAGESEVQSRWTESVRLYGRDELRALVASTGFDVRAEFGDLAGGAWSEDAERLVLHAVAA